MSKIYKIKHIFKYMFFFVQKYFQIHIKKYITKISNAYKLYLLQYTNCPIIKIKNNNILYVYFLINIIYKIIISKIEKPITIKLKDL